jgi:uncharacterized protein YciI
MKHFLIEITYLVPFEQLRDILPEHRAHLKTGYERNLLLLSGPQQPKVGGVVIARAEDRAEIEAFFAADPYQLRGVARYRMVEFDPVLRQEFLESWMTG